MGYDMHITEGNTTAEQVARDAMKPRLDAAVEESKKHERGSAAWQEAQAEVERLYEEYDSLPSEYFRLNIWGMGRCFDYMEPRGMIYGARCPDFPTIDWPKREGFATDDAYETAYEDAERRYEELAAPVRASHPEGGDTIPSYKFGSNDGWLVTEAECAAAVAAAKASDLPAPTYTDEDGHELPVTWWPEWIDYLERASTRGGFTVY